MLRQQTYHVSTVMDADPFDLNIELEASLIPPKGILTLKLDDVLNPLLKYKLRDKSGGAIHANIIQENEESIDVGSHNTTGYFLSVYYESWVIKTFKVTIR